MTPAASPPYTRRHQVQRIENLTRRQFISSALAAALLIACGDDDDDGGASGAGEAWSFVDDRGVTATRDSRPVRIVAQEDAAAALWSFGIKPVATYGNAPLGDNPQFEEEDLTGVESVGEVFGEIDIEKMISLGADLIVTTHWPQQGPAGMGFQDEGQEQRIAQVAPVVAIEAPVPYRRMLARYRDLAASLGAGIESEAIAGDLKRLDESFDALSTAVAAAPALKVLAIAGSEDGLYVANPGEYSDLAEYMTAGVEFVVPDNTDDFDGLWEELSWERANKYAADVILYDGRAGAFGPGELAEVATWQTLAAVQAGQVGPWYVGTTYRLSFFTQHVTDLAGLIKGSKKVI